MDLSEMSAEDLAALLETAQRELAGRQTREAIVRDVTAAVDPIIRENRELLGESWQEGRLSWDGRCIRVEDPGDEPVEPLVGNVVEADPVTPVAYVVGENYAAGTVVEYDGEVLTVVKGHQATDAWNPNTRPEWFEEA